MLHLFDSNLDEGGEVSNGCVDFGHFTYAPRALNPSRDGSQAGPLRATTASSVLTSERSLSRPPTTRYSAACEFNNAMNSFKSFCSFAKGAPVSLDDLQENIEALCGGQIRVLFFVGPVGLVEAAVDARDPIHPKSIPWGEWVLAARHFPLPSPVPGSSTIVRIGRSLSAGTWKSDG